MVNQGPQITMPLSLAWELMALVTDVCIKDGLLDLPYKSQGMYIKDRLSTLLEAYRLPVEKGEP